ncbi:acetyltransferase [Falsiroseomonas sp. HW251]|uniref:acetyltransferase n=1 Tax=Falsiroseomonas sp. HW251 TaxID=3390998 RepID=UPI003D320795
MQKTRGLVLIGDSAFAEVAHEYFEADTSYRVAAFAVERAFLRRENLRGLPVVSLEDMAARFPPETHDAYAAVVYTQLNRLRTRLAAAAQAMGYRLASYVSPRAFVSPSAQLGEHCFVFEANVIQSFVDVGPNVVLWSGNHIGHHSRIGANVFVSSHVVISGFCDVGENCFLGVNAAVGNNLRIASDCWVGPGIVISRDTEPGQMFRPPAQESAKVSARRFFRVPEEPGPS